MEDAEQRPLSMTLILQLHFLLCRHRSGLLFLTHLPNVFFLINFAYTRNLSKKEPHYEKPFYGRLYSGEKLWLCLAKKGDEAAQRICQSYYQQ